MKHIIGNIKMCSKYFLQLIAFLVVIISCNKESVQAWKIMNNSNISFEKHNILLNDRESEKFNKIIYLFPKMREVVTDVYMRIDMNKKGYCTIYFYQGDPMKIDFRYSQLTKEKRLKARDSDTDIYRTTYQEQIEILRYLINIGGSLFGESNFECIIFNFEDFGELNVEITELCDSIEKKSKPKEGKVDLAHAMGNSTLEKTLASKDVFSKAIERTILAKDLRTIFKDYDLKFINNLGYYEKKVPYNQYAAQHKFINKHNTPHVYLINNCHVILKNKTLSYKNKR